MTVMPARSTSADGPAWHLMSPHLIVLPLTGELQPTRLIRPVQAKTTAHWLHSGAPTLLASWHAAFQGRAPAPTGAARTSSNSLATLFSRSQHPLTPEPP